MNYKERLVMANYEEKVCDLCSIKYSPTSPKQRYCIDCKEKGKKILQAKLDAKRNRLRNHIEYKRNCKACSVVFRTYYPQKKYCGSKECDKVRLFIKNKRIQKNRSKKYLIEKGRKYYTSNREKCLLKKAEDYRIKNPEAKEYIPGKINQHTIEYVREYIESHNYKLLSDKYINNCKKLLLECPEGHKWLTNFHNFKDLNNRCGTCYSQNNYISKPEQLIRDFITEELPDIDVIYNDRTVLAPQELDFYFPEYNLAIEVCGLYWHGELNSNKDRAYHYNKMMGCYNKGIRLITIFEDELLDHKEVVLSRIRQALGRPKVRIYARKCIIKNIDSKTANKFYKQNHVQGISTALACFGLYYKDELVSVGSLGNIGRKHTSSNDTIELKRFCTLSDTSVVGGMGKLFKQLKKYAEENEYKYIKSYCDMRYANIFKPVYEVLGFELDGYTKYTPHYFIGQKRFRNFSLRKTPEERLTSKTEWQLRKEQGYDRIWDCGHRTYVYQIN